MRDELLTIGRFARLCRLSVKQLRHYDETGLLRPLEVDPETGYRYYEARQSRDALTIALLREADVPLPVIAEVLAAHGEDRTRVLRGERDRLAAQIVRSRERLRLLDRLADSSAPEYDVTHVEEPARRLIVAGGVCDAADVGAQTRRCVERVLTAIGAAGSGAPGVQWAPPLWGLFPLELADGMGVSVGVETSAESADVPDGLSLWALGGGTAAVTVHSGSYAELPLAYHALFAWIHERGLVPSGPVREAYLVSPGEAAEDDLMTRIVIPISGTTLDEKDGQDS